MSPRADRLVRLLFVIIGTLIIAVSGWWLFKTMVGGGLAAIIIFLFLLIAGALALHELMQRAGDQIMMRLFYRPDDREPPL